MSSVTSLPFASWTTGRKVAAALFVASGCVALACAALYMAGAIFLVLNKADPRQASLTSIVRHWYLFADDARLRKRLQIAIGVSGFGMLVLVPAGLIAAARTRRPLHGDARFANSAEIARAGLTVSDGRPGILVGRHRGRYLYLRGQLSVLLSAPTRSGKGVGVVIPNLLNWPDSVVVLDVKGENYNITAGYRERQGHAIYAFSPFDVEGRSHRWNPLSSVRTSATHRVNDLLTIGRVLFPNDGGGTSTEGFFNDQARNVFLALGLLLLETPALPRTIGEMLRQSSGQGQPLKDHLACVMAQRREAGDPLSNECIEALQRLLSNSENTLASVMATFNAPLTIFAQAVTDAATSADDFRLEDLRRERMSVYVRIQPSELASARPLLMLFFSQLVRLNTQALPEQDGSLKFQCLLINDEFPAMGRVDVITQAAPYLGGYNLRLLTIVQAMAQLDAVYGDKQARSFATNHGLQILFAPREQRDADEYSAMLGHYTERATSHGRSRSYSGRASSSVSRNDSDQRRALLLPQEFKELGSERLVVLLENCKPILGEKIRYYRDKVLRARLFPAPVVPPMDVDLHLARTQQRWRYADEELPPGESLRAEQIVYDQSKLPRMDKGEPKESANTMIGFLDNLPLTQDEAGGVIEAAPDDDGVLAAKPRPIDPADFT